MSDRRREKTVILSEQEFEDIIYYTTYRASRRANDKLFRGLLPFLNKMNDDFETIIRELDYLKREIET
jgi:hypothetical protein